MTISHGRLLILAAALFIAACNSDRAGPGGSNGAKLAPIAAAGADDIVDAGETVLLDGSASNDDGTITQFAWTQVGGAPMTLVGAGTAQASFTVPSDAAPGALTFRLTVTDDDGATGTDEVVITVSKFRVSKVCSGPDTVQNEALKAFFDAREGDTIEFCEGTFAFDTGLILHSKKGITIRGAGKDKTILSFKESGASEGLNVSHSDGITLQGFTVEDSPGNAVRVFRTRFVTIRDVRTRWRDAMGRDETEAGYTPRPTHGAYGLYPVESRHILMEDCEAHGASDAGVYVGQSSDILVRNCLARYNVAGYEFENTYRAVFEDNVATDNTGGFLVFDLPGLSQYGEKNIVRRNKSYANNTNNFAPVGNIVGVVPRGTGMLILATDQLEIHDNEIYDNDTIGMAIVNFGLAEPNEPDKKYDFFPEEIAIHSNVFRNNGGNVQEPNPERGEASVLPLLLKLRNGGRGAHIVWDGGEDTLDASCPPPKDKDGVPLTQPNPSETGREEPRTDERGRPNYQRSDPEPACKYNAWKFDAEGNPKKPNGGHYIADQGTPQGNTFINDQPQTLLVDKFLRANITSGDPEKLAEDLVLNPPSFSLADYQTPLPPIQVRPLQLPYVPDPDSEDARPTAAERDAACNTATSGINYPALLRYNCPLLSQYNLFADATEPRSGGRGFAMPFELNSALFSDHAVKYRILFLPPDATNSANADRAIYKDHRNGTTATLDFPVGTVIAKTFAFRTDDADGNRVSEDVIETRLLIKRATAAGGVNWVGLPYVWETNDAGARTLARLKLEGSTHAASFDFLDPDPAVKNGAARARYTGSTDKYAVPAALNCITCHGGDDRESGAAPIGLKPRYLNRPMPGGENQLAFMQRTGLLAGLPADLNTVEKHPRWNVPGDSGEAADSPLDIHHRTRAYLEVNCLHCHNNNGAASNSGLFLDAFRTVNIRYGICKTPVAAGKGSGDRQYDIVPGEAGSSAAGETEGSILYYRVSNAEPGIRMPPLARSIVHGEAANLIATWINSALPELAGEIEDEEACTGTGLPGLPAP